MEHNEKPIQVQSSEFDEMLRARGKEIFSSPYHEHISQLKQWVLGKTVAATKAGTSGFVLFFTDQDWVIAYLLDVKLHWERGQGEFRHEFLPRLYSPEYGDGFQPLPVDLPYARQTCDMGTEIANAHGKEITGLATGEEDFNFCFPGGMELDANIVPTSSGKHALRVFWEQW